MLRPARALRALRLASLTEGVSYLVLLGVAMPLKYAADQPEGVWLLGRVHGALFVLLAAAALLAVRALGPARRLAAETVVASLIPFGAFLIDARLRGAIARADAEAPTRPAVTTEPALS